MLRGNQMFNAMTRETDRGKACVGDAMLDELFKELFERRFVDDQKRIGEMLGGGQPLASYNVRLAGLSHRMDRSRHLPHLQRDP
jgi:hypothetical protein